MLDFVGITAPATAWSLKTMQPLLVTRTEAAKRLGISTATFDRQRAAGAFPPPWRGTKRYVWPQLYAAVIGAPVAVPTEAPGTGREARPE
jgi:hypothetical protein